VAPVATPRTALAHDLEYSLATATFDRSGGLEISLQFHVAAYVLDEEPTLFSDVAIERAAAMSDTDLEAAIAEAEARLLAALDIEVDGASWIPAEIEFPTVEEIRAEALATATQPSPPVTVRGRLNPEARSFRVIFPPRLGSVMLYLEGNGAPTIMQLLRVGEQSWPYAIRGAAFSADAVEVPRYFVVAWNYLCLGFLHILPMGLDHILFVVGLFLLNQHWRPLLVQVTAFTVAHSLTLALAMYDVVSISPAVVEPIIALSIAYVAIENLCTTELKPWRPAVVFLFGLLHGLGFAGVLHELGVPSEDAVVALVTFNVGVELGQLSVIALAFAAVGWFRNREWYRSVVVVPLSCGIAFVGVYWTATRILASTAMLQAMLM